MANTAWIGSSVNGRAGFALDFDGTNDYVTASSSALPLGDATFTFAHWFLLKSTATSGGVFGWGATAGSLSCVKSYVNVRGAGVVSVEFAGNSPAIGPALATNRWYHFTFVKRPGAINATSEIWIDGTRQAIGGSSSTSTPNITAGNLTIGVFDVPSADYGPVRIADGAVWSRALTSVEIRELYNRGPGWNRPSRRIARSYGSTANRRRRILCGDYS